MISVTPYGGVNEIGGNKIALEIGETRLLLDFGVSFGRMSKFFDLLFHRPSSIRQLIDLGIIPDISGLYSRSVESGRPSADLDPCPPFDALFISHAHMDHIGHISLLSRRLKVYMGVCTKIILDAISNYTYSKSFDRNYSNLDIHTFRSYDRINIGSVDVIPIHVDHSIPGSYGFIIETNEGSVIYTGDLRHHGTSHLITDFIKHVAKRDNIKALIVETTHADYSGYTSESEVMNKIGEIAGRFDGNILVDFSRTDYDRFFSVFEAAKRSGRTLLVDVKRVYIMEKISCCPNLSKRVTMDDPNILFYINKKRFSTSIRPWLERFIEQYRDKIFVTDRIISSIPSYIVSSLEKPKPLSNLLKEEYGRLMIITPSSFPSDIMDIVRGGEIYILASSEPYDEESEIGFERLRNWLEYYGIPIYHIHSSGHITPLDLKKLIETINPEYIVPIHGERPRLLKRFIGGKYRWLFPELGEKIEIT